MFSASGRFSKSCRNIAVAAAGVVLGAVLVLVRRVWSDVGVDAYSISRCSRSP